jgi:exonuclease VII small subunit
MGEQSLTPGEQRILTLMEQGQQRLERRLQSLEGGQQRTDQRMQSLEQRMDQRMRALEEGQHRTNKQLEDTNNRLQDLTIQVDKETADNKLRYREFAVELDRIIQVDQVRARTLHEATLAAMHSEMNLLRKTFTERLDQHHLRLTVLEQTLEQNYAHTHRNSAAIEGLQGDIRTLMKMVEGLVQAQPARMASAP